MTLHTQPVVAGQHQHQQQQTAISQQQQTTTISNTNINNNSTIAATTSNPATNNNQTQTVAVQLQHPNNNNNNNNNNSANNNNNYQTQSQNTSGGQIFNAQLQHTNVYVPAHGIPAHHAQHHHQASAMYQTMIPAALPSNVYVKNVTAHVNLHGWTHTVPHGAWVHPSGGPNYIHGDLPPEQGAPVIPSMGAMPVTLPAPGALTATVINPNPAIISGGTRGSRRGRGRGGNSGSRRSDYNIQRHPQPEGSPAPQQSVQSNQQEIQQQQQAQQQTDTQQMMTTIPASYVQHPQYAAHAPQYQYSYPTFYAPQQHMLHPGQSTAAQQATGPPLYFSAMPVYNGPQMYNYGYYLPPVINQSDYQFGDEVGVGDERQTSGDAGTVMWHPQTIYSEEYDMSPGDMHALSTDDLNHNTSSIGSANETPSLLSPNYPPLYEQMTQQMGVMQIYDDPQMGQMQVLHPQAMEDELSECGSQQSAPIQMVPPIQMISAATPAMTLQVTNDQLLHQQTPHIIAVPGGAIMPIDDSITSDTTTQHQLQSGDNANDSNLQLYENVSNMEPGESATSLNDEFVQQPTDNLETDYVQQAQQQLMQPQPQIMNQTITAQPDNYSNKKLIMTDVKELQDKSSKKTLADTNTIDVAVETTIANNSSNKQQQPVYQQQHSQEKQYKQQQQYASKSKVPPTQQQYQHQQMQTQPAPKQQQQQHETVSATQSLQQTHYQTSTQQQHHQQQHHQQVYENRKSSQIYNNQQHQSRSRKFDYHHGYNLSSSNNENSSHQQQTQQTTKTMSWTNSSQHKKSTNTVAVTATPATSQNSGSYTKQSHSSNSSSSHAHGTRTYTSQQHHSYQHQQNHHYQQQQHQPQTRNYGAMKMPSSPISSASNTMERKTSQSSEKIQTHHQQQTSQPQATSTASTTAAPHQFPHQQSQQNSTNDTTVHTNSTSPGSSTSNPDSTATIPSKQHINTGFATKKHGFSNQSNSATNAIVNIVPSTTTSSNAVETTTTPAINLAPPVTNTTPQTPSTQSWASLFSNNSNSTSSSISKSSPPSTSLPCTLSSTCTTTTNYSKKPVAKVAPYEGVTPVTPSPPAVTPGTLSYSAASAQNLPTAASTASTATPAVKQTSSTEQQSQRNSLTNLDEYTLKFAEFLTKYKSDWTTISLRPRGLTNRSNYCYINSILQALIGCSPLYNLIKSIPKQAANLCEVKTPTINAMITFTSNFSNLPSGQRLRNAKGTKGNKDDLGGDLQCDSAFEPTEIYKLWNDSREEHVEGRQEDAEEFLSYILNKLNDEMLEVIKLIAKPNAEQNGTNEPVEEGGDVWQMICNNRNKGSVTRQTDFGCTPLSDIFRGELRSRLQREGEHSTDVIQPFFTLQLNIEKAASVKEALEILVGRDQLEGVTGSKTKQEVVAWQQMNLEKLPPVLILHLKWFDYRSHACTKILKKVEFPVELKIDATSKKHSQKQRAYRLFAVVYHDGKEATKGHYITDVYHTGYGSWLRYDDSSVKPVNENHVLLPRAPRVPYLLCYRRCDTMPQQSSHNQSNTSNGNNPSINTQSSTAK